MTSFLAIVATAAAIILPPVPAAVTAPPAVPAGYHLASSHNFATSGLDYWHVQDGSTAPVSLSKTDGVAVTVTKPDQSTEVVSDGYLVRPGSFVQAYVYLPAVKGEIANFPALWMESPSGTGQIQGEIDMIEGLTGKGCSHTHYTGGPKGLPGLCVPGTAVAGWHVYTALWWKDGQVTFWYDGTRLGQLPQPATAPEQILFQNRSSGSYCPPCYGPSQYPSRAWLKWVKVWNPG
jgi:hypothetical protein